MLAGPPAPQASESPQFDDPPVNWDNPIEGLRVQSIEHARARVPFEIHEPRGLGTPSQIFVTPSEIEARLSVVAFTFDTAEYGRVVVIEHFPDLPAADYDQANQELAAMNGEPNVFGSFEVVPVRSGAKALITTSPDEARSSIFWLEGEIEIVIRGPEIDRAKAIELAEKI